MKMFMKGKLMKKLGDKEDLDPLEKEAKMGVVKELSKQAGAALGDKIKPMKKVEVASDSPEGLKAGLEKAEEMVEGADEMEDPAKGMVEAMEDCSPEEIDAKIAELEALKAKKQGDNAPGY